MSNMHQHLHLTSWKPMATQLPPDWVELSNTLAEEVKGSFRFYVLDVVKYDAQKVGNLLRSWGLPWQVVMAGYLWEYDEDKIRHANLYDAEMVLLYRGQCPHSSTHSALQRLRSATYSCSDFL